MKGARPSMESGCCGELKSFSLLLCSCRRDIPTLVQDTYRWEKDDVLRQTAESQSALEVYQLAQEKKRDKARGYVILPPKVSRLPWKNVLDDWMRDESARSESQARAAVRDGDPSIEVLVMVQHRDGTVHFLPWQEQGETVPTDRPPSLEESRKIARQRLRLPGHFSRRWNIDTVIPGAGETKWLPFEGMAVLPPCSRRRTCLAVGRRSFCRTGGRASLLRQGGRIDI